MANKRKLLYKDMDFMRFIAYMPILLFVIFYLMNTYEDGIVAEISAGLGYVKNNSIDFFFFLSAFLLCSHSLREYKYKNSFSTRQFYIRRLLKIVPLIIPLALFAFLVHPFITRILQLSDVTTPGFSNNFLLTSDNIVVSPEQYIYYGVLWFILLFLIFSFLSGAIFKLLKDQLKLAGYTLIILGIADRAYHVLDHSNHEFDLTAYGIPIGIGILTANVMRNEQRMVDFFKETSNISHLTVYFIGICTICFGYLFLTGTYFSIAIPIITSLFFAYAVFEQTFSKHSIIKFRKLKAFSKAGKMTYGLIVYLSIISAITVISMDSLELKMDNSLNQVIFALATVILTWTVSKLSYNYFERPILNMKREFKST